MMALMSIIAPVSTLLNNHGSVVQLVSTSDFESGNPGSSPGRTSWCETGWPGKPERAKLWQSRRVRFPHTPIVTFIQKWSLYEGQSVTLFQ